MSDIARTPAVMPDIGYWALPDSSDPYLLARVRWPDVAEAISPGCPDWRHDTGLFDLPYNRHSRSLTEDEAALWAARWGANLPEGAGAEPALVLIRRMPATWSNLSPADRRAWALDGVLPHVGRGIRPSWLTRLVAWAKATTGTTASVVVPDTAVPSTAMERPSATVSAASPAAVTVAPSAPAMALGDGNGRAEERRRAARVRLQGTVELRLGQRALAAELVDVSESGFHCTVRASQAKPGVGRRLASPVRLATQRREQRLDLDVAGAVSWRRAVAGTTHLGIALEPLDDDQRRRVHEFLAAAAGHDRI